MPNHESEPTFFSFVDAAIIWTKLYDGLPFHEFGPKIYLIEFAAQALEDPKAEPIAVYHYAGIRRYFWRSRYWSEYDAHAPYLEERTKELLQQERDRAKSLNYRKLLDMLKAYARRSWVVGSTGHDIADVPFSGQHHTAIVYPIR
jgi:hypothetical protein